jgi:tetratricopeptide (TPR) repeat protein
MTPAQGNGAIGSGSGLRDPETDKARLRAVHASLSAGDIAGAGKMAEDALADGIDHAMVLNLVAGRREEEGRFEEALALLQRAKAGAPGAIGISNALGLCLTRLGRLEEAVAEYDAALAIEPDFAQARANRGTARVMQGRPDLARGDFERALAVDPGNLVALAELAALALQRGDPAEARALAGQVRARQPDFPGALVTLAGADIAEGKAGAGEARLRVLLGDSRLQPIDQAQARGMLGDALDAQGRFDEAFAAWSVGNRLRKAHHRAAFAGRNMSLDLVRAQTASLAGKRIAAAWGRGQSAGGALRHVFLVGFPRSGTTLIEQMFQGHRDVVTMAEKECLIDAGRVWMSDAGRLEALWNAPDAELDEHRAAYWKRVAEEGVDPKGKVFVDKHPFHSFKLPLIARLFPEARILFARRDPRDNVLSCFRHRFRISDPAFQMLTLDGAAELFAATMDLAVATERAFGLFMHPCALERIVADFDAETRAICAYLGIEWTPEPMQGLDAQGIGKWRDYEGEMAPVLPILQPWIDRFGY